MVDEQVTPSVGGLLIIPEGVVAVEVTHDDGVWEVYGESEIEGEITRGIGGRRDIDIYEGEFFIA